MKNGKFAKRGVATKTLVMALAIMLVVGCAIGGTLAWLTDTTKKVENTFTVGNIDIDLTETTGDKYKMVPGNTIVKDPKVTVEAGSEACWLFVKVEESSVLDTYITYAIADGWTELTEGSGIYWRSVDASTEDQEFAVLEKNTVTVNSGVTKAQMDALKVAGATQPTLSFTAYAVQKDNVATATDAWAKINPPASGE